MTGTFLHLYFAPWGRESRAFRAGRLAVEKGLAARVVYVGHQTPENPDTEDAAGGLGVLMRLPPRLPAKGGSKVKRVQGALQWIGEVRRRFSGAEAPALIQCHSLASLPASVALKRATGAPLLFDAHELESQRIGWAAPVRWGARATESLLLKEVDHTIVVGDKIREWYEAREPKHRFTTVRNVPGARWEKGVRSPRLRAALGLDDQAFVFLYLGLLNRFRGVAELIDVFKAMPADRHIVFVGYGEAETEIRAAAAAHCNIHFHPAVPPGEICEIASGADVGLCIIDMSALSYRYALPNKLFEYIAAGLCVICTDGPEMRQVIEESGLGWTVPADDRVALDALLRSLDRTDVRGRVERATYVAPTWESEGAKLEAIYRTLLDRPRQSRARA
jgi:glycosyltransferase involved in cell wall biosynthesis